MYHEKHGITIKTYFNIYWKNPWPLLAGENWKDVDSFNNLSTVSNILSFEVFNKKLHMLCKNVYFLQITEPAITCKKILKSFSQREVTSEKERQLIREIYRIANPFSLRIHVYLFISNAFFNSALVLFNFYMNWISNVA